MGTYSIGTEELVEKFEDFLKEQEGDICAEVIAECWNILARKFKWDENLIVINKFTKKVIE